MDKNNKDAGTFTGCASCVKHCCLLMREDTKMCLYISGSECEQIEALMGKSEHIKILSDGRIFIQWNEEGYCPFVTEKGCSLGEKRPLPCKFYPYGIMNKNNRYYLIRWINVCESFVDSKDQEVYDTLYRLIYPGLEKRAITLKESDEGNYEIIQKLPDFFLKKA